MRKILKIVLLIGLTFNYVPLVKAQFATYDAVANAQTTANNTLTKIISGLSKIQAGVNNDALLEAIKTSGTVTKQFALINQVYSVANGITNLKKVKDFFETAGTTTNSIAMLNSYLANKSTKGLSSADREIVKTGLDFSIDELKVAIETIQFALQAGNKLSVSERLKEFNSATESLNKSIAHLEEGKTIVYRSVLQAEKKEKSNYYYNYKYGIKN